jgi:hypothetical protein
MHACFYNHCLWDICKITTSFSKLKDDWKYLQSLLPSMLKIKIAISFCDQLAKGRVVERFDFEAKGPEFKSLMSSNDNNMKSNRTWHCRRF